jgi:general stress protein 26
MKALQRVAVSLAILLNAAQALVAEDEAVVAAARSIIESAQLATLVTLDDAGHPRARTMDPFPPEAEMVVWMATNRSTRKVREIETDSRATLHYYDAQGIGYVTLLGRAELIDDDAVRASRYKAEWGDFYDDGPHGDDYVLIRFVPFQLEVVSLEHSIASEPKAWKPAIVELRQSPN